MTTEQGPQGPSQQTAQRLRDVLGDYRSSIQNSIAQAREVDSPLKDEELTQRYLEKLSAKSDIAFVDTLLWQDEFPESIETISFTLTRLYNHGEENDDVRQVELDEMMWDEDFHLVSEFTSLLGFDIDTPLRIEIVDWTEQVDKDFLDYHASNIEQRTIQEIPGNNDEVNLTTRQVRYYYPTDLPGIELVLQFPTQAGEFAFNPDVREYEGEEYDLPTEMKDLHSLRIAVSPQAYAESLKDDADPSAT